MMFQHQRVAVMHLSSLTGRSDTVMCQAIVPQLSHMSMPSEEETKYFVLSGVVPVSGLIRFMSASWFNLH